jgi:hypothetical protein
MIMAAYVIVELTENAFNNTRRNSAANEIYWFAIVDYSDGDRKFYKFDKPYDVKVSDFFDKFNKDNTVKNISIF